MATTTYSEEALLTVEQVAARLSVHRETVRRLMREKKLHGIKIGRTWRLSPSTVEQLLEAARPPQTLSWSSAAQRMAPVYADAIATADELTASTTMGGAYVPTEAIEGGAQ